ncbi:MAG: chemotaxis protein CheB [Bradyrhizobium sp.]
MSTSAVGDADVIVSRRGAGLVAMAAPAQADYPWHPSTDRLVRSALNYMAPSQLIGILMTGMGNDGAEAMALMHTSGGRTIAEAEETAVVWACRENWSRQTAPILSYPSKRLQPI